MGLPRHIDLIALDVLLILEKSDYWEINPDRCPKVESIFPTALDHVSHDGIFECLEEGRIRPDGLAGKNETFHPRLYLFCRN